MLSLTKIFCLLGLFCGINSVAIENCSFTPTKILEIVIDGCDRPDGSPIGPRCVLKANTVYSVKTRVNPASSLTGLRAEVSLRIRFLGNLGVVKRINNICGNGVQCPTAVNVPQWFNMTYQTARRTMNMRNVEVTMKLYSDQSGREPEACSFFHVDVRRR